MHSNRLFSFPFQQSQLDSTQQPILFMKMQAIQVSVQAGTLDRDATVTMATMSNTAMGESLK